VIETYTYPRLSGVISDVPDLHSSFLPHLPVDSVFAGLAGLREASNRRVELAGEFFIYEGRMSEQVGIIEHGLYERFFRGGFSLLIDRWQPRLHKDPFKGGKVMQPSASCHISVIVASGVMFGQTQRDKFCCLYYRPRKVETCSTASMQPTMNIQVNHKQDRTGWFIVFQHMASVLQNAKACLVPLVTIHDAPSFSKDRRGKRIKT